MLVEIAWFLVPTGYLLSQTEIIDRGLSLFGNKVNMSLTRSIYNFAKLFFRSAKQLRATRTNWQLCCSVLVLGWPKVSYC